VAIRPAALDRHVLALDIARVLQALPECDHTDFLGLPRFGPEPADDGQRQLRPRPQWPRCRRTADEGDEFAPADHSITSSARASSVGGTVRPNTVRDGGFSFATRGRSAFAGYAVGSDESRPLKLIGPWLALALRFAGRASWRTITQFVEGCQMSALDITCFSDVLCVWAYASQARIEAVKGKFGDAVRIEHRFCSVFGDTAGKIATTWKDRGGYEGFNAHLRQIAERFPHIEMNPDIWLTTRPATSASAHLFLKAIQELDQERAGDRPAPEIFDQVMLSFRQAFFRDARDISRWNVQCELAEA
jgi:hypothetical protein